MAIITSNAGKIGIGFVSCFFDVVLLVQHFCLYGKNNTVVVNRVEEENPFLSNRRLNSIDSTKAGFSPMASAVIYHAPKGDVMMSTASFRDVFSRDINDSHVSFFLDKNPFFTN